MKKPVILIAPTHLPDPDQFGLGRNLSVKENYVKPLLWSGAIPLLSTSGDPDQYAEIAAGILFIGGVDVDPVNYSQTPLKADGACDPKRDAEELALFRAFYLRGKPILGICRGMQLINVALGGTLWQDIGTEPTTEAVHGKRHELRPAAGSLLIRLFGDCLVTNSFHHQAVREAGVGMRPTAISRDGIIEAIEHEVKPVFGVQWHPERMIGEECFDLTNMMPLFADFVKRCAAEDQQFQV